MDKLVRLSQTEIELGFAASCVEGVARKLGTSYRNVFERMKRVGLIEKYILPCYDVLHTESRENVTNNVLECLTLWEERAK